MSAQEAAIAKKQEAERLRLFAIEEAKVKKQEAEQAARDRVAAAQTEKANKAFQKQMEQQRLIAAKQAEKLNAKTAGVMEMKPTEIYCNKATGLSKGFSEMVGWRMRVSVASVSLLSATPAGTSGCFIKVDTSKGPQSCTGGIVYSDGKAYWIGGDCW